MKLELDCLSGRQRNLPSVLLGRACAKWLKAAAVAENSLSSPSQVGLKPEGPTCNHIFIFQCQEQD